MTAFARARALNPQVCLELLCHASFSVLLFSLTHSGKYLTYVTPRMAPYLYFAAAVMLLWAGADAFRLFRPRNRVRVAHCLVPAIPILLLLLPHSPLSASDVGYGYAGGSAFAGPGAQSAAQAAAREAEGDLEFGEPQDEITATDASSGAFIEVEDDAFYSWLNELYMNLDTYVGCQISVTGFVFKDPETLAADEFVPARLGMTCCVADLVPYGLVCKYAAAGELAPDTWVKVRGVVRKGEYAGFEEPQIEVTSVEPAEPVEGYIYPFEY
ncbi:MAG: TIGR03943 family protein [Clostridiales Family XIII bacterium]|jgi:putative membrane protein|nr:TIGR03943 family protein [Clostridiales Family XIII bacterium]